MRLKTNRSPTVGRPILPQSWRLFVRARLVECALAACILLSCGLLFSLVSYSPSDPSGSNVGSSQPVSNWLGSPGAFVADVFRQSIGVVGYVLSFILICWGVKVWISHYVGLFGVRIACTVISLFGLAVFAGSLEQTVLSLQWIESSDPVSFGGALGYVLSSHLLSGLGYPFGWVMTGLITSLAVAGGCIAILPTEREFRVLRDVFSRFMVSLERVGGLGSRALRRTVKSVGVFLFRFGSLALVALLMVWHALFSRMRHFNRLMISFFASRHSLAGSKRPHARAPTHERKSASPGDSRMPIGPKLSADSELSLVSSADDSREELDVENQHKDASLMENRSPDTNPDQDDLDSLFPSQSKIAWDESPVFPHNDDATQRGHALLLRSVLSEVDESRSDSRVLSVDSIAPSESGLADIPSLSVLKHPTPSTPKPHRLSNEKTNTVGLMAPTSHVGLVPPPPMEISDVARSSSRVLGGCNSFVIPPPIQNFGDPSTIGVSKPSVKGVSCAESTTQHDGGTSVRRVDWGISSEILTKVPRSQLLNDPNDPAVCVDSEMLALDRETGKIQQESSRLEEAIDAVAQQGITRATDQEMRANRNEDSDAGDSLGGSVLDVGVGSDENDRTALADQGEETDVLIPQVLERNLHEKPTVLHQSTLLESSPPEADDTPAPTIGRAPDKGDNLPNPDMEPLTQKPYSPDVQNFAQQEKQTRRDPDQAFVLPSIDLLESREVEQTESDDALNREQLTELLEKTLEDFGVHSRVVRTHIGPVVTQFEIELAPGTKTSRVISLADDIARSMSALSVRIANIPGSSLVGIELPNATQEIVDLRGILSGDVYRDSSYRLPMTLGKDINGDAQVVDLATMPHLLIAGTTGSGKSVGLNAMILSLLYGRTPAETRFIMIDPKMLELSVYDGIPHMLVPVVTDPKKAVVALKWAVKEMEDRYRLMSKLGVRNIEGFNRRSKACVESGMPIVRQIQTGFDPDSGKPVIEEEALEVQPVPYIVIIVDEFADLMLVAGKEIEASLQRLAQMARAAGIHIIMATQRPSVDVVTGTIKANFPSRISYMVSSKIDSRTILGEPGAEQLIGKGDLLFMAAGGRLRRCHAPFVDDEEVERVCSFLRSQGDPEYNPAVITEPINEDAGHGLRIDSDDSEDIVYQKAMSVVVQHGKASTSFVQRQLQIGYNRAARIIEQMERNGVVSPANHVGRREVIVEQRKQA